MIDFDAIVAAALKDGATREDIAAQMSQALNKSKANEEREAERKRNSARNAIIDKVTYILESHITAEHLDMDDAAALIWLHFIRETDEGRALISEEELLDFKSFIRKDINSVFEHWKITRRAEEFFGIKSKETAASRTDRKSKTDEEAIEGFLKAIGLM